MICMLMIILSFLVRLPFLSILWSLLFLSFLCSCFMLYNSNSILLFFTIHAFFKYDKPINMKLYHSTLHNLNLNRSSYLNTLKTILHISSIHHFIASLILFEHSWNYSNQPKQIYSTYSWFGFIKHIYFAILIYIKIIVSQWVKYHISLHWTHDSNIPLCPSYLDSTLENQLKSPIRTRSCKQWWR